VVSVAPEDSVSEVEGDMEDGSVVFQGRQQSPRPPPAALISWAEVLASESATGVPEGEATGASRPREEPSLAARLAELGDVEVVLGVPMSNIGRVKLARRVIVLAAVGATYNVCTFIWRLMVGMYGGLDTGAATDSLWSGFSQLVIELTIPACGYYGALYAHRTLVFFFCGANLVLVVATAISFFRLVVHLSSSSETCMSEKYASAKRTCEVMHSDGMQKYVLLLSLAAMACFACLSFGAGKRLYQGLGPLDSGRVPLLAPLVGEVVVPPPGATESGPNPSNQEENANPSASAQTSDRS